ncbi:hypothetical protein ACFSC4_30455 [Deinococcus malanensis]|uniref:hypothetical protein n=1 Tax=Deinococcus malanensis TaxID=1706855 RepID=UPI00363808E2
MAKQDTVNDIKAANGAELNPDEYTQKELDTLLASRRMVTPGAPSSIPRRPA